MSRITRELSPRTTMEALRRKAKRWLREIEAGDQLAVQRFRDVYPGDAPPRLREVQQALAREFGQPSWAALKQEVEDRERSHAELVDLFLEKSVNRYSVDPRTGKWGNYEQDSAQRGAMAGRLLARHPEIARESIHTAVVAHDLDAVRDFLARDRGLANDSAAFDGWTPLFRLAHARLPGVEANALAIAAALLEAGAAHENRGGFTPLTGVIGGGEGGQSAHPLAEAFARALIAGGADPMDGQALYNTSLGEDDTFWLDFLWDACAERGETGRWRGANPNLIGPPLDYLLGNAVPHHPKRVAWLLAHGARGDTNNGYSKQPVLKHALLAGRTDIADMLVAHGAQPVSLNVEETFCATVTRGDLAEARRQAAAHPEVRQDFGPLFIAAGRNDAALVAMLLELGVSPDISPGKGMRALHVAADNDAIEVAKLLIAAGAEIDVVETNYNSTPLGHANFHGKDRMIALLAPLSRDVRGLCFSAQVARLRELLAADRSLAVALSRGEAPLFALPDEDALAVEVGELLLSFGADLSVRNAAGETPAQVARRRGLDDAAALLEA